MKSPLETGVDVALVVDAVVNTKLFCPLNWIVGSWFGSLPSVLFSAIRIEGSNTDSAWNTLTGFTDFNWSPVNDFAAPVKLPTGLLYNPVFTVTSPRAFVA